MCISLCGFTDSSTSTNGFEDPWAQRQQEAATQSSRQNKWTSQSRMGAVRAKDPVQASNSRTHANPSVIPRAGTTLFLYCIVIIANLSVAHRATQ